MGLLVWKGCCLGCNRTRQRQQRTSLQSVSNSETDVTVNLSTFGELLTVRTTQKAQQNRWMDPSKDWGQNEGSRGLESTETKEKRAMGYLQKGALPKLSLYCPLSRRRARVRETYR